MVGPAQNESIVYARPLLPPTYHILFSYLSGFNYHYPQDMIGAHNLYVATVTAVNVSSKNKKVYNKIAIVDSYRSNGL